MVVRSSRRSLSCEDVGIRSSVSSDRLDWNVQHPPAVNLAACAVYGPLKRQLHTVPASETVTLLCALRNSDPPLQVGYDCKVVGDTWRGGSGAGTSAKSPMAELWREDLG